MFSIINNQKSNLDIYLNWYINIGSDLVNKKMERVIKIQLKEQTGIKIYK